MCPLHFGNMAALVQISSNAGMLHWRICPSNGLFELMYRNSLQFNAVFGGR